MAGRYKPRDEWTVEDHLQHQRDGSKPISEDYRTAARKRFERTRPGSESPYLPFGWSARLRNPGPVLTAERCQELRAAAEKLAAEQEVEIERLEQHGAEGVAA